jgi:predicted ATPase/class 3 adenylate cyclase
VIPTPDQRLRVFISSTLGELAAERAAARAAVESLRLTPVMFEMGARQHAAEDVYRDYLRQSDVFVGIYWQSYGWVAPGQEISGVEDELRLSTGMPRLIYLKEPAPERDPRLADVIAEVQRSGVATKHVAGASELGTQLVEDLAVLLSERFARSDQRLPAGTVTFMFADVEGSTRLLEAHGDAISRLLGRFLHEGEEAVSAARGVVVKNEGDGFLASFPDPMGALEAAEAVVRLGAGYPEPGPLWVRVGLHTGRGVVVDGDYVGLDVHRAARVGAAANGGQILMSSTTRELTRLPTPNSIVDLGWYELRGISQPEHLHQLTVPGLTTGGGAVRARASTRAHVPLGLTPIVGREAEIESISRLLADGVRLLNLTGPGGIGKTRLAMACVARVETRYPDGIGFVDFAAAHDPDRVAAAIAGGLGHTLEGDVEAEEVVVDELRDRRVLLVLDNFETVAAAGPLLRRLLERLPLLQILVTSRVALRLTVETEFPVAPLERPAQDASTREALETPSVRLLVERAAAVRPDFVVTADMTPAVVALVRRLDGMPLAIELAAARLRVLSPADLLRRLDSVLDVGEGGTDRPDRQRTLRAAIESSYESLPPLARSVFDRLGVFGGGWSLQAAEAVVSEGDGSEVAGVLEVLAANSLIRVDAGPTTRMRMLSPVRDYARERLDVSGDADRMRERHARHHAEYVTPYPRGSGAGLEEWRGRTSSEWDNISDAVAWMIEAGELVEVARMLANTWPLIWIENRMRETEAWANAVLEQPVGFDPGLLGRVEHVAAFFALERGDYTRTLELALAGLGHAEEAGDVELEGLTRLMASSALPAFDLFDDRLLEYIDRAVVVFRDVGDIVHQAYALNYQASYRAAIGDLAGARASIEEALELSRKVEVVAVESQSAVQAGFIDLAEGATDAARVRFAQALRHLGTRPGREVLTLLLDGHGLLAVMEGRMVDGMAAFGAAEGLRDRLGRRPWPLITSQLTLLRQVADSVDDPDAIAARVAGRQLSPAEALSLVGGALPDVAVTAA